MAVNSKVNLIHDGGKREMIGNNAIIRSMDFSIERIMERWDNIFKN